MRCGNTADEHKLMSCPFTVLRLRREHCHGRLELERLRSLVHRGHLAGLELGLRQQHVRVDAAQHAGHRAVVVVALASLLGARLAVVRLDVESLDGCLSNSREINTKAIVENPYICWTGCSFLQMCKLH